MDINHSLDGIKNSSKKLNKEINIYKLKILQKEKNLIYEQNNFDKLLDNFFLIFKKITFFINSKFKIKQICIDLFKMIKNILVKLINSSLQVNEYSNKFILKSKALEKKLEEQEDFIKLNLKENRDLKKEISKINSVLTKFLDKPEKLIKNSTPENLGHNSITKVDFYQEENVRLGSELFETKKKFEILKSEIEKYEQQRSNLVSKINSVNDALKDTNIVTNVFENEVKQKKIDIIDHSKIEKKNSQDLNEQIKEIFTNKN